MPIFEFMCADCGQSFEELVLTTSKTAEVACPSCQGQNITKKISIFTSRLPGGSPFSFGAASDASCSTGSV